MKTVKSFNVKGYTMIELMLTLMIFAIITLFAVPAFFTFIERSRAKSQIAQAANFMRSAQEIAIANNRTIYVFTEGLLTYETDTAIQRAEYWHKDWVMAFKPMGMKFITMPQQVNEMIANPQNYTIAKQKNFSQSKKYALSTIDSNFHSNTSIYNVNPTASTSLDMEGYSKVRSTEFQGAFTGAPTFIAFYPSGEVSLPIFVVSERTSAKEKTAPSLDTPFKYDFTFNTPPKNGDTAHQWNADTQKNFAKPIALLGGCRTGRSLSVDAINYTFNPNVMQSEFIFNSLGVGVEDAFNITLKKSESKLHYHAAPSFGYYLCGSKFLR